MDIINAKTVENFERYGFFHACISTKFTKDWFIRNAPDTIVGAGEACKSLKGFLSLSYAGRRTFDNEIIYVGSPDGYIKNIEARDYTTEYTNCTFLIDECADLEWLSLADSKQLSLHLCNYMVIENPITTKGAPITGYTSGVRMVLLYYHCGILDRLKSIEGMQGCSINPDITPMDTSYNLFLGNGVWTKYDYLKGYLFMKSFLIQQGYPDILKSPLDQFPISELLSLFGRDFKIILPE